MSEKLLSVNSTMIRLNRSPERQATHSISKQEIGFNESTIGDHIKLLRVRILNLGLVPEITDVSEPDNINEVKLLVRGKISKRVNKSCILYTTEQLIKNGNTPVTFCVPRISEDQDKVTGFLLPRYIDYLRQAVRSRIGKEISVNTTVPRHVDDAWMAHFIVQLVD